jgi:glycosyltransferase involved in cell wall biosynthesis
MRILYFHQHFSTPQGSAGTRSYEFAKRLVARGHQVSMICGSYASGVTGLSGPYSKGVRRGTVAGFEVIEFELPYSNADRFLKRTWIFLRFVLRSMRIAVSMPADLIFATSTPLTVAIPGIVAKWLRRRRFVFVVRDLWPELPRAMGVITNPVVLKLMDLLESLGYRSADGCIGLAPGIVEGIRRKVPAARTAMIPNGSDLDEPAETGALPSDLASCIEAQQGKLKCIFSGAHGMANGLGAVLDAARELKQRRRDDIVLVFIGAGMMKPALVRRAREEQLDNCVFLDPIPKHVLVELKKHVDVGLMILADVPAFYNGTSPNKFFDYLAAGLPVLINYPGWLAGLVEAERCGIAVAPGRPTAFADALERLADQPEERSRMGQRARALAQARFSRNMLAEQFAEFIEAVARDEAAG